ncbi:ribosome maturation factor RimM [Luteibaculum oceani]|uniref:Ribosome maturation factor RimM n=1 Tax=Luteibaculum oceani TaxID=1294296 RepID=A0A5C6V833_9FLAO|nr:ribosome maturation factor RimM [Luteibaculum oceani]TXC81463.1 16S rRNA processing protein RimM [Luteibaculum oceani]
MNREDCFNLGKVTKIQGYSGNVICFLDTDQPGRYENLESVLLEIQQELVPFFIEQFRLKDGTQKAIVKFAEVDSEEEARSIVNCQLYLPLNQLPDLGENKFYFHEIIGFQVLMEGQPLGTITEVLEYPNNELLQIHNGEKEILIPLREEFIQKVDKSEKTFQVSLPEGFLEAFTQ